MTKTDRKSMMICPCCGQECAIESLDCDSCGARRVGDPLPRPDVVKPKLGPAFNAFGCALIIILAFAATWLLGNNLKVARVLLVWTIGDGLELTRGWLQLDPDLPYYRIFSYDAYRLAFFLSFGLIPLSLIGMWLGRRALRLARLDAARFGGLRLARVSLALSMFLFLSFSAAAISSIPRALEQGRAKRLAETRAKLYQLHTVLSAYYREHGTNPPEMAAGMDYWENVITYTPDTVIASKNMQESGDYELRSAAAPFSNYVLRSAGPDGIPNTADDIVMRDGVIGTATETDLPTSFARPR